MMKAEIVLVRGIEGDPGDREVAIRSLLFLSDRQEDDEEYIPFKEETAKELFSAILAFEMLYHPTMRLDAKWPTGHIFSSTIWTVPRIQRACESTFQELWRLADADHLRFQLEYCLCSKRPLSPRAEKLSKRLDVIKKAMTFVSYIQRECKARKPLAACAA
jgi:hypothetical protein